MRQEQFQHEKDYGVGIAIASGLLERGLITPDEHRKLKAVLIKKHKPILAMLESPTAIPFDTSNPPQKRGVP